MDRQVVVTGVGIWNALGRGFDEFSAALEAGRNGIRKVTIFDTTDYRTENGGQVEGLEEPGRQRTSRCRRLFDPVIEQAFQMARLDPKGDERRGVLLGTTVGGITNAEEYYTDMHRRGTFRRGHAKLLLDCNNSTFLEDAIGRYRLDHLVQTYSTACSAGAHAVGYGMHLVRSGALDIAVVGGVDPLSRITQCGFGLLRALTSKVCRPFDKKRSGIVIGEGAAVLILESRESAQKRGVEPLGVVAGYGATSDAYHPTAPDKSGSGPSRAMLAAMADGKLTPDDIDYVNAHGTSTKINDMVETKAIRIALGERADEICVSSTKAMMGHCMGASGAMEAIACVAAIRGGFVPPTINYQTPDPKCDLDVIPNEGRDLAVRAALSNSFGFGGNNACLAFTRVQQ